MQLDHQYIEEHRVAERYLRRTLAPVERARFEEHFPDCPECLDRLALAEMFRGTNPESLNGELPRETSSTMLTIARQLAELPLLQKRLALATVALLVLGSPVAFIAGAWWGFEKRQAEIAPSRSMLRYEAEASPSIVSYGVAITNAAGKVVSASTGLSLKAGQSLGIPLKFDSLPPGDYTVTIRAKRFDGSIVPLRTYAVHNQPR